ncbi:nucleic acid-binding protein [Polychaeton citri CBS 116435]|uniref:rRNA biogenesis protein RRP5 n=1 Tax=Polychaeton citri CBS 116435 TaxID=1314669 RepID=A0A9P4QAK4_9PEZI|nr:nucleic acid-binding protein [Polychaeton citri CBS 116435]
MSSIKRKAVTDDRPAKKAKGFNKSDRDTSKDSKSQSGQRNPVANSILQQQDRAFPRGGAGVLTPLEQKQIKAEAERDALFESQNGQTDRDGQEDDELFDESASARKQKKARKGGKETSDKQHRSGIKIQGLSYKTLVVGSTVLGQVTSITSKDIALALPNNLTGFIPIESISERLNARVLASSEGDEDDEIDFSKLFYLGQWLRAVVTATDSDTAEDVSKNKRHINLSVDPAAVNNNLAADSITTNTIIQAAVRSVEDHGLIMDLGLSSPDAKGFISKKELGTAFNIEAVEEGQVLMCFVTGKGSDGQVIKLSPDPARFSVASGRMDGKAAPLVTDISTIEALLPGVAVDFLVTESGPGGVVGKALGLLDVVADAVHSSAFAHKDMEKKYKVGSKIRGRLIWATPTDDGSHRVGVSLLEHLLTLPPPIERLPEAASSKLRLQAKGLEPVFAPSSVVQDAEVSAILPSRGVFLVLKSVEGKTEQPCFVHISQLSDSRVESIASTSGAYQVGSLHAARILSFNPMDGLYYASLKKSVLDQRYLRIEDLSVGEVAKGVVERLILSPVMGVIVKLSDNVTALVPEMHFADAPLQHPERKFREGFPVKGRVLSIDTEKRQVRLTLKKTLVNTNDQASWTSYESIEPGQESYGTIINTAKAGAVLQFFGSVRGWLPVAEMSETFVESGETFFKRGQTVKVRALEVDSAIRELKVTCKTEEPFEGEKQKAWEDVHGGDLIAGSITLKTSDSITIETDNGLNGIVRAAHLVDGSSSKSENALKRFRVGQKLSDLLVLRKLERSKHLQLTYKPTMVDDAKKGSLIKTFEDAKEGHRVHGFVRNVTPEGIYVEFASGFVALVPKSQTTSEMASLSAFGLRKDQSISAWILKTDDTQQRVTLSMREQKETNELTNPSSARKHPSTEALENPVDQSLTTVSDLSIGKVMKVKIATVRGTQLNVRLAENVQGRIDASETFSTWEDIKSKKAPLQQFKQHQSLECVILGIHDAKSHRFLPISHRQNRVPVFELSAKASRVKGGSRQLLAMDSVQKDETYTAFVNNHSNDCLWVNLSPNVRGRIALMDLSADVGQLQDLEKYFPIGCALRVKVKHVDALANRLDLTARLDWLETSLSFESISSGMVLPARVTKIGERSITVQLSDTLAAPVPLIELSDDLEQASTASYEKNDIVRVCVLDIDIPNKRLNVTLRPSKVLSSSMHVIDPHVTAFEQLRVGDIRRGFVKHVGDKGAIVSLGAKVDALVRISDLSDSYVKEWKKIVTIDQLVKGRIVSVDANNKHALMSLKASQVDAEYVPPVKIEDLEAGSIVTGKVRKVEDFGAFVDIDNTQPRLSGLCHRSEVAARRVEDVRKLYSVGDVVKAKILNVDIDKRKISLGLKASYFDNRDDDSESESTDDSDGGVQIDGVDSDMEFEDEDIEDLRELQDAEGSESSDDANEGGMDLDVATGPTPTSGLKTNGFDWSGTTLDSAMNGAASDSEVDAPSRKRKRAKAAIQEDKTGDLDKYGPQSTSDFERQLLGEPNNSTLWIQYMAFQLQLGEVQKAREIAERALQSIHIREQEEKGRIWVAWLNLEVEYGDHDRVEGVFKEACMSQDSLEMHERLASIYITGGKNTAAEEIFERIVGNKAFRASPEVWINFATFLMTQLDQAQRARALLPRALQSIPTGEHRQLTAKFAALEFKSPNGDAERGRTVFEGLVDEYPKWSGGWDNWVDLEKSRTTHATTEEERVDAKDKVRALYQRIVGSKMKPRRAMFIFKSWDQFEQQQGDQQGQEKARKAAEDWTTKAREAKDE